MLRNLEIVPSTEPWSELLEWLNRSMPMEAPNRSKTPMMLKVEDCGYGVPYVLMLPTMLPIIHTPLLTSKVKVPARADYEAVINLKIMQDALRRNGIVIPGVLANNQQKLIGRNFQANLQLLQWFRGLYVALQQCGIEAGEGRIVLASPSNDDSSASLDSSSLAAVRAEERRRSESAYQVKPDSPIFREVRKADSNGAAAAAAAVAILSEGRSRSQHRSQGRNSLFDVSIADALHSPSLPLHRQQTSGKPQAAQRALQSQRESVSDSHHERQEVPDHPLAKPMESPPPSPPLATAPRAAPMPPPSSSQLPAAARQAKKPVATAGTPSQTRPAHRKDAQATPTAAAETHSGPTETTKPVAAPSGAPHHRSSASASRRPLTPTAATGASGGRPAHRADSATPKTRARTPTTGRNSVVVKPIPKRLSVSSSAHRLHSEVSGGTPRIADANSSRPQSGARSRQASTPKRGKAGSDGHAAAPLARESGARQTPSRQTKHASKPIIELSKTAPVTETDSSSQTADLAATPASVPAPVFGSSTNNTAAAPASTAAPPSNEQAADVDVLQLRLARQFYYDKLRAIEELVNYIEAKKNQERKANAGAWDRKDAEVLDFANSVRCVLYAES
ncbi:hypothetical protein ABL78_2283 [Leptomonas seymouri]|uniref:EB1 C-terminal domain-containing protein n=1 Tax=Leptomonas seymouri TaxID=5684 RepID=A0A0N1I7R9_LEPSE|nr:hypothetical protein ABL78_2283 [Leptomonas seymouri]|eukprot:KPI88615.1 hypothetical protein ABL78_2283 [Leptomonas seymouri]